MLCKAKQIDQKKSLNKSQVYEVGFQIHYSITNSQRELYHSLKVDLHTPTFERGNWICIYKEFRPFPRDKCNLSVVF